MEDDPKKYIILENILQKFNQKYISLPDDEKERNNKFLKVIDKIIQKMRSKNTLFDNLYQNIFYGGSYYDGLKVGKPSEYDLDCVLRLPKVIQPKVEVSDKPGYVHVVLNNVQGLQKKVDEAPKYVGLDKLLEGNRLSTQKVKSWIESLISSVIFSNISIEIDGIKYTISPKLSKSGPAMTFKIEGTYKEKQFNIDIDLVPCFVFFDDQWPKEGYRLKTSKNTFFVVPKSPNDTSVDYWRLSFQEQERELISGFGAMKPVIRLIKKIRDRYKHKIASYYIKTVFLWELEKVNKDLWQKPLGYIFIVMLNKYREYILQKNIPYYWNDKNNLIEDLQDPTVSCIANNLKNIVDNVNRNLTTDPYAILQYLLIPSEVEAFKKDVNLGKKHLKRLTSGVSCEESQPVIPSTVHSESSSVASSFEEITKDMINDTLTDLECSNDLVLKISNLEIENKRLSNLLETAINNYENKIDKLTEILEEMKRDREENRSELNETKKVMGMINKKMDDLLKVVSPSNENLIDSMLLPIDRLRPTLDFQTNLSLNK